MAPLNPDAQASPVTTSGVSLISYDISAEFNGVICSQSVTSETQMQCCCQCIRHRHRWVHRYFWAPVTVQRGVMGPPPTNWNVNPITANQQSPTQYLLPITINNTGPAAHFHVSFGEFRMDSTESESNPTKKGIKDVNAANGHIFRWVRSASAVTAGYLVPGTAQPINDLTLTVDLNNDPQLKGAKTVFVDVKVTNWEQRSSLTQRVFVKGTPP
jgi:hypothetical protein